MKERTRSLLHADLDAFYASVEQLDHPELRGVPVAVGGRPETRGVVAAASYEARRFGVRSAMPMSRAFRLCPQLVRVSPRFDRYGELSQRIMGIFRSVTPLVEPLSLDEAFLDVTGVAEGYGGTQALGRWLKQQVREQTGLTVSVGGGTTRTVAKIASDRSKPDGLLIVPPGGELEFLHPLPVRALWGVGPRAEEVLAGLDIRTIGDLARAPVAMLERVLGSRGPFLQRLALNDDPRPVVPVREHKSVGAENTFVRDLSDGPELRAELARLAGGVARRLAAKGLRAGTIAIKLRYGDFRTVTRQMSRAVPTGDEAEIRAAAEALLAEQAKPGDRFRLLGVSCSRLTPAAEGQLTLWELEVPEDRRTATAGERSLYLHL